MSSRAARLLVACLGVVAVTAAAGVGPGAAAAADWCGSATTQDRPPALAGRSIRVVYAYPSDGTDRSAEIAPRISADVEAVDTWWRQQDPLRQPRFDRAAFSCGLQADILALRLSDSTDALRSEAVRGDRIVAAAESASGDSPYEKLLVFYDGPVGNPDLCGEGEGRADGDGVAIVYLAACTDVPTSTTAAHELLHAFGALATAGPPHGCPDNPGHPCDSQLDVLYPFALPNAPIESLALDVGHDDYYGHSGSWLDVQDSLWLQLVSQQIRLAVVITGRGSVRSNVPGVSCGVTCATDWDAGSVVTLEPLPAAGQRLVRWSGACSGSERCVVTLDAARSVTAFFAPERFGLVLAVSGRGKVTGAGLPCAAARCARQARSYTPVRLRAAPAKGWRLAGWNGACSGRALTCTVGMTKASSVRARFVKA